VETSREPGETARRRALSHVHSRSFSAQPRALRRIHPVLSPGSRVDGPERGTNIMERDPSAAREGTFTMKLGRSRSFRTARTRSAGAVVVHGQPDTHSAEGGEDHVELGEGHPLYLSRSVARAVSVLPPTPAGTLGRLVPGLFVPTLGLAVECRVSVAAY
jgi:hypothetical protein